MRIRLSHAQAKAPLSEVKGIPITSTRTGAPFKPAFGLSGDEQIFSD